MVWYKHLKNKIEALDLDNRKVNLNSVISFSLPMYTLTILFFAFTLTKQKESFLEQPYMLQDNVNDCVSMVTVSEYGVIQLSSIEEEEKALGDLYIYLSCRDRGPKDYRNYLGDNKAERLTF